MGQNFYKHFYSEEDEEAKNLSIKAFPDLTKLPPELALTILSNLNATDLYLASCVWKDLVDCDILWQGLCVNQWRSASIYERVHQDDLSFKALYLLLDEATLTFNADVDLGREYILRHGLVDDNPLEWAKFIHGCKLINWNSRREFLTHRPDVLHEMINLQNFGNQFLPNALRHFFFNVTSPPNERNEYLSQLVDKFSHRFCQCNPNLGLSKDSVYVVCFSLILLSVDLSSPHIKNKMSKREFIRNTRRAASDVNDDFAGHLYDNVYLIGHVAPRA